MGGALSLLNCALYATTIKSNDDATVQLGDANEYDDGALKVVNCCLISCIIGLQMCSF